ncbi:fimbria/pilus periplasmic chaperone [Erwinia sp. MMLR14_017]|uniref:fimbria/pilus periplasmic chaperone n=1 Tax=Erwinia sp. MMLR14_017 TaxID=3093842 RepID=UPI00299080DE|nr:fimbria/pilus periplasmic chaperone [Erwinia sp. MMLR14_017]MDW8845378.1 fimbria/pilus periplasmic chaperone [Erwinia sp. MMLR14_017]
MRFSRMTVFAALIMVFATSFFASGGMTVHSVRIIYPTASQQESASIMHASNSKSFLRQLGVKNASGEKANEIVMTPIIYVNGPGNENKLRIMPVQGSFPSDQKSLSYFVSKTISSINKTTGQDTFKIAMANRIKQYFLMMIQEMNGWRTGYLNMSLAR